MGALKDMILDLISRAVEEELFEFKVNWHEPHELGEHIEHVDSNKSGCWRVLR